MKPKEALSELSQRHKIELFAKIGNGFQLLFLQKKASSQIFDWGLNATLTNTIDNPCLSCKNSSWVSNFYFLLSMVFYAL